MKKDMNFKNILLPAIVLLIIAGGITALLAITNSVTKEKIAEEEKQTQISSIKKVFAGIDGMDFDTAEEETKDDDKYYIVNDASGNVMGYAFITAENGYGGEVQIMTGITTDNKITGVEILSQSETPGLGANATKAEFRDQFKGDVPEDGGTLAVKKDGGTIDALSGATITSRAVTKAVNDAINLYNTVKGE